MARRPGAFGPDELQAATNVSRETISRLEAYVALLREWTPRINLIARGDADDVWQRHIWDSLQLLELTNRARGLWVDLGSGAGLPGLVIAIAQSNDAKFEMHLIEADSRKAAFLREAARITSANVKIHAERIENLKPFEADIISARALAPLPELLDFYEKHGKKGTLGLFLKGKSLATELTQALPSWSMDYEIIASRSDDTGQVLRINSAERLRNVDPSRRTR